MPTLIQMSELFVLYLFAVSCISYFSYKSYKKDRFSLHLLFSLVFLLTFYMGQPFSIALAYGFGNGLPTTEIMFWALIAPLGFYFIYHLIYTTPLMNIATRTTERSKVMSVARSNSLSEAKFVMTALLLLSLASVVLFYLLNGVLLFELNGYNQIFSQKIDAVALKRFFYFFIPGLLIWYFLNERKVAWWLLLFIGVAYGVITYLLVGGTRANIAIAISLFFFIGLKNRYINLKILFVAGVMGIIAMFGLALVRYGLDLQGWELLQTFLYLTRDTFSPWQNFATILQYHQHIDYQGLAPIIRDFYVYIPKWIWSARPDEVLNTANYFTWEILGNHSGLAISPTLIGSFFIMGGVPMIIIGALLSGLIIKGFDGLYSMGQRLQNKSNQIIINAYYYANIFNVIILVREGLDAFVSRFIFFTIFYLLCVLLAKIVIGVIKELGFTKIITSR